MLLFYNELISLICFVWRRHYNQNKKNNYSLGVMNINIFIYMGFLVSLVRGWCVWSVPLHPHSAHPPHGLCALVKWDVPWQEGKRELKAVGLRWESQQSSFINQLYNYGHVLPSNWISPSPPPLFLSSHGECNATELLHGDRCCHTHVHVLCSACEVHTQQVLHQL